MSEKYSSLAPFYDILNSGTDYNGLCSFLISRFESHDKKIKSVLDLACGTGSVTIPLAKAGYDMTGVDISADMLARARMKSEALPILYLNQDIRFFELYGSVDAVVCCLDSLNYLLKTEYLENTFSLVSNYLNSGGIFIFDVNTPFRLENIYGNNSFVIEEEDIFCAWQNFYEPRRRICTFYLSMFENKGDLGYIRHDEVQRERAYSLETYKKLLKNTSLEIMSVYSGINEEPFSRQSEKWYFVCRKK